MAREMTIPEQAQADLIRLRLALRKTNGESFITDVKCAGGTMRVTLEAPMSEWDFYWQANARIAWDQFKSPQKAMREVADRKGAGE